MRGARLEIPRSIEKNPLAAAWSAGLGQGGDRLRHATRTGLSKKGQRRLVCIEHPVGTGKGGFGLAEIQAEFAVAPSQFLQLFRICPRLAEGALRGASGGPSAAGSAGLHALI